MKYTIAIAAGVALIIGGAIRAILEETPKQKGYGAAFALLGIAVLGVGVTEQAR